MLVQVRSIGADDISAMMQISEHEPNAPHWTPAMYHDVVEQSRSKHALACCAVAQGAILGFYVARQRLQAEWELETIVVAHEFRGKGIGRQLMEHLISCLRDVRATRVLLEVRASNDAARHLYATFGFHEDGRRRNYYSHPQEDAVLLSHSLSETC